MKKVIFLIFASLQLLIIAACSNNDVEFCGEGYIEYEGKCLLDDRKTDDTQIDTVTCEQGYTEVDGECIIDENKTTVNEHKMFELKENQREYINVPYKRIDGVTQYLDIYYPDKITEDMPVFMYVHGGGFLWGNKDLIDEDHRINHVNYKNRLNELGYVFISVEYQKTKNNSYPCLEGQISDVKDAVKWVKLNHEDLSSTDENIGLWGLSAGGALALSAALNPDENYNSYYPEISSKVKYVIDFYGVTDIYNFYNVANYENLSDTDLNTEHWRVDTHTNISSKLESNYPAIKEYVDAHSPLYNYGETDIKIAIHHGDSDKIVSFDSNAQVFYDKGISLGNEIYITSYDGRDHGFWWDSMNFYNELLDKVISEVQLFSK